MDVLSPQDVTNLLQRQAQPCVSLYMPAHRGAGRDVRENPIRLRNLLDQAEQKLLELGVRRPAAREMLQPARDLVDDASFWREHADGLALFIDEQITRPFRLPLRFSEFVHAGNRFHLLPVLPLLHGTGLFYVVAVSQNEVRLLRCTRDSFEEIDSLAIPQGKDVILRYIEEHKALQWHTGTSPAAPGTTAGGGKRAAVFHGHGVGAGGRHHKDRIFEYFRLVTQTVRRLVHPQGPPTQGETSISTNELDPSVVFAGVDFLFPIFQEANNRDLNLLDEFVAGNPDQDHFCIDQLHRDAWAIVEPYFEKARRKARELYLAAEGVRGGASNRASNDLADVVRAAHDGRVSLLLVPISVPEVVGGPTERWGRYDPTTGRVELHDKPRPGDDNLLDLAATETFIHGGHVYAVDRNDMPHPGEDIAAVTRF